MKIESIRIKNFRSFRDEVIHVGNYTCFVGPNGAGKSTILSALNVFFREQGGFSGDSSSLDAEDFFQHNTSEPVLITVTFTDLSPLATEQLSNYVRQGKLTVTASAHFSTDSGKAPVSQHGERLGMPEFGPYFLADKSGAKAQELKDLYGDLKQSYPDLPVAKTKGDMAATLQTYESQHPDKCELISSPDDFYGIRGTGRLSPFIQWIYVPAVKHASDEGEEGRDTALGKLIARAVQSRSDFQQQIESLREETLGKLEQLIESNQPSLNALSASLKQRLADWAHPGINCELLWKSDPRKAISIQQPVAGIKTGERDFLGDLSRMGHGLQRSYLLALLQELAASDGVADAPTLLLGCEEPELYQHPPQARHLSSVFQQLSEANNQILVTSHSPYFVSGQGFEQVRMVRRNRSDASTVTASTFSKLCEIIDTARGENRPTPPSGMIARIHQSLQPNLAEMFFCAVPIFVEGLEDVAYITAQLHLSGQWEEFRRLGCHLVPANKKDQIIEPLALALEMKLPAFVVFDADGNTVKECHRRRHELDNRTIIRLLELETAEFPTADSFTPRCVIWKDNIGSSIESDFGAAAELYKEEGRKNHGHIASLDKKALFIADYLCAAAVAGHSPACLLKLNEAILAWARSV